MSPYEISKKGRDFSVVISGVARVKQVGGGGLRGSTLVEGTDTARCGKIISLALSNLPLTFLSKT